MESQALDKPIQTQLVSRILQGAIAQLVECLNGIEEVSGSSPLSSISRHPPKNKGFYDFTHNLAAWVGL